MSKIVVLIVAHGSPAVEGLRQTQAFRDAFAERCKFPVHLCYLELAEPDLASGLKKAADAVKSGGQVVVLPLLLGAANHQKNDLPMALHWAREEIPQVQFIYASPFEPHANLIQLLSTRIDEALAQDVDAKPKQDSIVLVVGRGSSDPQSNSEIARAAYLLSENRSYRWVTYAFQAVMKPNISDGVQQAAFFQPAQLIVAPFLLFGGFVEQSIRSLAMQQQPFKMVFSSPLGIHPLLVEVALQRLDECVEGRTNMTCDLCKYRLPFAGYEQQIRQEQSSNHFQP